MKCNCTILGTVVKEIKYCPTHTAAPLLLKACISTIRLFDEALPRFDWGASALDANAITVLNETELEVRKIVALVKEAEEEIATEWMI